MRCTWTIFYRPPARKKSALNPAPYVYNNYWHICTWIWLEVLYVSPQKHTDVHMCGARYQREKAKMYCSPDPFYFSLEHTGTRGLQVTWRGLGEQVGPPNVCNLWPAGEKSPPEPVHLRACLHCTAAHYRSRCRLLCSLYLYVYTTAFFPRAPHVPPCS